MAIIISLLGVMASGKGVLGARLAVEFRLYHLSIGDLLRSMCKPPVRGAGEYINDLIENGKLVPDALIDTVSEPAAALAVRIHNYSVRRDIVPSHIALPILREKMGEIDAEGTYNGILLDGFPRQLDQYEEARGLAGPAFPLLAIYIDCPVEVARARYLQRARGADDVAAFDYRLAHFERHMPPLVREFEASREEALVRITNDGSVTVDAAYDALVARLAVNRTWNNAVVDRAVQ